MTQGISQCLERLTDLAAQQAKHKDKEQQDKDRERYRAKGKPTEIVATQAEAFLISLLKFEEEMREDERSGEDLFRSFVEATRGHRAGDFLTSLKQTEVGQLFHQRLANVFSREAKDAIYDEMYQYFRNRIYQIMGG